MTHWQGKLSDIPESGAPFEPPADAKAASAIVGVGVDVVETARIERILGERGSRFRKRIFTDAEIAYCDSMPKPALHYAARFAAKEAFSKALGTGIAAGVRWRDIEVYHIRGGKPALRIAGRAADYLRALGAGVLHVSLSHADDHSAATAIIERARTARETDA